MISNLESDESIITNNFEFEKEKLEALTIRIPTQIKNQLKKKAEKEDLSLSQILRKLIKEYLSLI
jgi:predicted DNA binding CopG/RHH family protein